MWEFRARCGALPIYDHVMKKLTAELNRPDRYKIFKAVAVPDTAAQSDAAEQQQETIIGFSEWMFGYLETPKVDPFAPKEKSSESGTFAAAAAAAAATFPNNVLDPAASEAGGAKQLGDVVTAREAVASASKNDHESKKSKPFYSNPDQEVSRKMGNAYICAIRGKKHLCKHFPTLDA